MALHRLLDSGRLFWPDGDYQFDCSCGAKFRSPVLTEAASGYRNHLAEPVYPSEGSGT